MIRYAGKIEVITGPYHLIDYGPDGELDNKHTKIYTKFGVFGRSLEVSKKDQESYKGILQESWKNHHDPERVRQIKERRKKALDDFLINLPIILG